MTDATRTAWGWGLATVHDSGRTLDTWFPSPPSASPTTGPRPPGSPPAATSCAA